MEINQNPNSSDSSLEKRRVEPLTPEQMLEMYENTKKIKKYLQWQLYITIILVVLPLLAMAFLLPSVLKGLGNAYGGALQGLQ